jgi:hypothetical protein
MARRRVDDEEDDTPRRRRAPAVDDEDDSDEVPAKKKSGENAYTGMLVIALLALIGACVMFYLDHSDLTAQTVSAPNVNLPPLGGQAATPAGGAAGTPQG